MLFYLWFFKRRTNRRLSIPAAGVASTTCTARSLGILRDQGVGADERLPRDMHPVGYVAIAAEIGVLADRDVAVENHMRRQEGVILDPAAIADLAAAPDHHIVSDCGVEVD